MECYKRALKSSLVGELAFLAAPTDQINEKQDFLCLNGVEDFSTIDCFFDFGDFKDGHDGETLKEQKHDDEDGANVDDDSNSNSSSSSNFFLDSELHASVDHVEDLEWFSKFVEDSSSSEHHPVFYSFEPEARPVSAQPSSCALPFHVPTRKRTKRSRQTGQTWFGSTSTDYSSSSSSSSFSSSTPHLIYSSNVQTVDILLGWSEPAAKKPNKISQTRVGSTQFLRRCSHCQVNKTPQWRTGPLGAKTLCNACGVRYKSGRLFPEYRPACSPTFSSDVHSNSHRKVLEIRKTRESRTVEPNFYPNGLDA